MTNSIRDELGSLRAANERLTQELALARDTLRRRTDALNATGADNDQMRATLNRVQKLAADWDQGRGPVGPAALRNALNRSDQETK